MPPNLFPGLAPIRFGRAVCGDLAAAERFPELIGDHLADAGLGRVSEIFDGDPPHTPRGCPAQAWSVATVLEAWWRLERAKLAGT